MRHLCDDSSLFFLYILFLVGTEFSFPRLNLFYTLASLQSLITHSAERERALNLISFVLLSLSFSLLSLSLLSLVRRGRLNFVSAAAAAAAKEQKLKSTTTSKLGVTCADGCGVAR
jgi:hypothetical protein